MVTGLLIGLIVLAVFIVIGALIVQLATKIAAGFKPSLGNAIVVVIVGLIAGAVASWLLHMVLGSTGSLVGLVVAFLLNAFIINALVKQPSGGQMGFGKACLVTLIEYIIEIVLCVVLFFVFGTALIGMIGMGAGAMP